MAANPLPRWLVLLSVILVILACFATELAFLKPGYSYTSERWVEIGITLLLVGVLLTVVLRLPLATRTTYRLPLLVHLITLALFVLPVGQAVLGRLTGHQGFLLEVVLAGSLRNLAMALACMIYWPRLLYTAVMVSLFLMVFALVQGEGQLLVGVLAGYSVLGCLWLLGLYWIRLVKDHLSGPAPWGVIGLLVLVVTGILVMTMIGPAKAAQTLWGFLPSSGGRDDYDPFSRGGVNTGDEVIRGSQDSKSTGMTDSDYFLDSPDDALYDVTHDLYGDVVKPRNWQRAISIPAEKMLKKELIPAESLDASREFSLLRKPPPPTGDMENTGAAALIYIQGRVPAHLRLKAYDLFDGLIWSEPVYHGASGNIERDDPPWMRINTFDVPKIFAQRESHVIKVAKFKTEALPFPANVIRFRVGKVDDRSFFGWSQDGILKMADRTLPKGTVTQVESSMVDPHALEQLDWERPVRFYNYLSLPGIDGLPEKLEKLAQRYVTGIPRGWKQIEAIIAGVKHDFQHNRLAQPPLDCRDVLSHFLNAGEGRDVDFATLAAMLLRTQGYPCRVVSGFYGNPAHHDAKTDHTFVYKDDFHFWVEVLAGRKVWVPLEPTPGYELAPPVYSWIDRMTQAAWAIYQWSLTHPILLGIGLSLTLLLLAFRRDIVDLWYRILWVRLARSSPREQLRYTLELLEWRSRGTPWERPPGTTLSRWYPPRYSALEPLVTMYGWAGYAPPASPCPWPVKDIADTCSFVVHRLQRRQLHRLSRTCSPET